MNFTRALPFPVLPDATLDTTRTDTHTSTRTSDIVRPSIAVFSIIILAMFALCFTVAQRTRAEMFTAAEQHAAMSHQVENLRTTNTQLKHQLESLRTNPRAIEAAARTQLGMVRAGEIIVPVR